MTGLARAAGTLLFALAALSRAAVPDSFPDQPGALTPAEIQAATQAMQAARGAEPDLPLAASGRRELGHGMPAYALFAGPLVDFSDRVRTRRQIVCNFLAGQWRCGGPQDEMRMSANGLEHLFYYQVLQGAADRQVAADVVDFIYSACHVTQITGLGGTPVTPSPGRDYVNTVLQQGSAFTVATGALGNGDSYGLQKTDKASDGCGFKLLHARVAKTGAVVPESYAREQAKAAQQNLAQYEREAAARVKAMSLGQPISELRRTYDKMTDLAVAFNALFGVAALIGPFAALAGGRRRAAHVALVLSGATLLLAVAVMVLLRLASITDTGNCLLLVIPLTCLAMLSGFIWLVVGVFGKAQ